MRATNYMVKSHGVENCQYFQGAGVSLTQWTECYTGNGQTEKEAFDAALDSAAQNDWDVDEIEKDYEDEMDDETAVDEDAEECYYYVTVYVK